MGSLSLRKLVAWVSVAVAVVGFGSVSQGNIRTHSGANFSASFLGAKETSARPERAAALLSLTASHPSPPTAPAAPAAPPPQSGPPNAPVLFSPSNGGNGTSVSPTLDVSVTDPAGSNMTVTFYG